MSFLKNKLCMCSESRCNSISNAVDLKNLLPDSFEYNLCELEHADNGFISRFRINIRNKKDALQWLEEFSYLSRTTFRTDKVFPQDTIGNIYKVSKYCHHKTRLKESKNNINCTARIVLTVKQTSLSRKYKSKDVHLQDFPTVVILHHIHTHAINSADTLRFQIPSAEVKEKYLRMFTAGYCPSKAYNKFSSDLQEEYGDQYHIVAADKDLNPDMQWVYKTYYEEFRKEYDEASGKSLLDSLKEFINNCNAEQKGNFTDEWFASPNSNDIAQLRSETIEPECFNENSSSEVIHELYLKCNSEKDDGKETVEELEGVFKKILEKVKSNPEMIDAAKKFIKNSKSIKTDSALKSALARFGKYRSFASRTKICISSSKRIGVQPTALARRKVKCNGHLTNPTGRPPKEAHTMEHVYSKIKENSTLQPRKKARISAPQ